MRDLFRNSRLIGRRFRIVHVGFGRDIVEVATFRAGHNEAEIERDFSEGGRILSDNVYGDFDEDVHRRDFAMNALYYQPETNEIRDEVGGINDIREKRIRLIGDPDNRFREDPVRMLRAIRFKAKLGFEIDPATEDAILRLGYLLQDIPPARLFEEVLKLFMNGNGERSFLELVHYELFGWLFPDSRRLMDTTNTKELIRLALASTDERIEQGKPVTPAFVYAAILWQPFLEELETLEQQDMNTPAAMQEASSNVVARQLLFTSIPRRFSGPMRDIWNIQFRLPTRFGRRAETVLHHKRFRAGYDFLVLREQAGEDLKALVDWWEVYQEADHDTRHQMVRAVGGGKRRPRRRPTRGKVQGP